MSKFYRAQDITITIRRGGEAPLQLSVNSGSFNRGLGVETFMVAGKDTPEVDGINGAAVLQLDLNVRDPDYHTLMDRQEAKNRGDEDAIDDIIDAEFSINMGRQGVVKYLMPDCTAHDPTTTWGGGTDRVTDSATLTASKSVRRS